MRIAEEKVSRQYRNAEILNSYYLIKDGQYNYYEIVLIDRDHPVIKKDKKTAKLSQQKGRSMRGLTSAAKRAK